MRLICLNCNAQYEVDASAIPTTGRDVQCSNCGNAWFQDPEPAAVLPDDEGAAASGPQITPEEDTFDAPPLPPPKRRVIDESVLAILREEAEREAIARRADAATLEMQGELGLSEPAPAPAISVTKQASAAATVPRGVDKCIPATTTQPVDVPQPAQREQLPDIAQINSSLSPSPIPDTADARTPHGKADQPDLSVGSGKQASGFWSGFGLMLLLAGLCMVIYLMVPQLSRQFPAAADALAAYQADVNALRGWLDALIRQITDG
jgi:predicted Zn finger-like uncharacterized protein